MNRAKDFTEDLQSITANVESEVGRYVKLLRHETTAEANSSDSAKAARTVPQQETKAEDSAANDTVGALPTESHVRIRPKPRQKAALAEQIILENVTARLQRGTNELLTEAALRQKLKKLEPNTRQDIVEEAVREWLRKHDYAN